jgi:hypothetical protein
MLQLRFSPTRGPLLMNPMASIPIKSVLPWVLKNMDCKGLSGF